MGRKSAYEIIRLCGYAGRLMIKERRDSEPSFGVKEINTTSAHKA